MSECSICRSLTKDNFDQKTSVFTSRRAALYFLLNTLLTIKKYRDNLCYCSQREQKRTIFDIIWHTNEFYGVASLDAYYTFISSKKNKEKKKRKKEKKWLRKDGFFWKSTAQKKIYPSPEPFPERPSNHSPYQHFTLPLSSPPFPPPRNSPSKGIMKGEVFELKDDCEQQTVVEKLLFGEYETLIEMTTDVNGGQESKLIEKILYKQMRKLLREDLKKKVCWQKNKFFILTLA